MKLSHRILSLPFIFAIVSLIYLPNTAYAGTKEEPDKVVVVEQTLDDVIDDDFASKEELASYEEIWDFSKDIQVTYGNLCFHAFLSQDGERCWIHDIDQLEPKELKQLVFPDTVQDVPVTKIGSSVQVFGSAVNHTIWGNACEPFHGWDSYENIPAGITSITLPSTVTEIDQASFCGFRDLTSITIPDGVSSLYYSTFYNCIALKKVVLPKQLESLSPEAFKKCKSLDTISISSSSKNFTCKNGMLLSKDGKTLVWVQPKLKKLTIPNTITTIGPDATTYSYVTEVYIPKSVTSIKNRAFNGSKIKKITISSSNPRYAKSGSCIYSKKTHRLVVGICTDGTLTLPSQVYYLKENISIAGKYVNKLTIPSSFKQFQERWNQNQKLSSSEIYFVSKTPPAATKDSLNYMTCYVPKGCVDTYTQWYYTTEELAEDDYPSSYFHEIEK